MALRYHRYWLITGLLLIAVVIFFSITSHPPKLLSFKWSDKLEHFASYFVLMGWFMQLYRSHKQRLLWALLFAGQGLALEIVQGMSRWRTFDYWDATANTLGVMVAWVWAYRGLDRLLPALERRLQGWVRPGA
ncbi:MAG TPA: hypothetical protein VGE50_00865 [Gammaproteobacteria bacterium]